MWYIIVKIRMQITYAFDVDDNYKFGKSYIHVELTPT